MLNLVDLSAFRRWGLLLALALPLAVATSCDNDEEPDPENEEETIPEVRIQFFTGSSATGTPVYTLLAAAGADGIIQPNEITSTGNGLNRNQTYAYTVTFGNADLDREIGVDEADEHRFFLLFRQSDETAVQGYTTTVPSFTASNVSYNRTLIATDADRNGCAIGLRGTFTIPQSAGGSGGAGFPVVASLRHQPPAGNQRVKTCAAPNTNGNPTLGEADVEVLFNLRVN